MAAGDWLFPEGHEGPRRGEGPRAAGEGGIRQGTYLRGLLWVPQASRGELRPDHRHPNGSQGGLASPDLPLDALPSRGCTCEMALTAGSRNQRRAEPLSRGRRKGEWGGPPSARILLTVHRWFSPQPPPTYM